MSFIDKKVSKSILKKSESSNNYYNNADDSDTEKLITDNASTITMCDNETNTCDIFTNVNGTRLKQPISPLLSKQVLESIFRTNNNIDKENEVDQSEEKNRVLKMSRSIFDDVLQGTFSTLSPFHPFTFLYRELVRDEWSTCWPNKRSNIFYPCFFIVDFKSLRKISFVEEKHAQDEAMTENKNKEERKKSKTKTEEVSKDSQTMLICSLRSYKAKKLSSDEKRKAKGTGHTGATTTTDTNCLPQEHRFSS